MISSPNSVTIVQAQLDAYNAHDLDGFIACYSEDVRVATWPSGTTRLQGRIEFAGFYRLHRFNRPDLHAELVNRMVFGQMVIDHEVITGLEHHSVEAVAIYHVHGGLITNVHFIEYEPGQTMSPVELLNLQAPAQ